LTCIDDYPNLPRGLKALSIFPTKTFGIFFARFKKPHFSKQGRADLKAGQLFFFWEKYIGIFFLGVQPAGSILFNGGNGCRIID
jgi:hypothetical protein